MKNLLRTVAVAASLFVFAGCASNSNDKQSMPAEVCIMSNEPVDADSPSAEFHGETVRFCCTSCERKWNALDDAQKQAKLDAHMKK